MSSAAGTDPPGLPAVLTREEALAAGLSAAQIRQRVESGQWKGMFRGVYLRRGATLVSPRDAEQRDLMHVYAAVGAASARHGAAVSHGSAALALRLPLVSGAPARPHLIVPPTSPSGTRAGVTAHRGGLHRDDAAVIDVHQGWRDPGRGDPLPWADAPAPAFALVTSPARTVLDVARTASLADALSVGDRAIRTGLVTAAELAERLSLLHDRPGTRRAALALAHLDGARESSLESLSFAHFVQWGIPLPEVQVVIELGTGRIARVDFLWRDYGLIGEADGAIKYTNGHDLLLQGQREALLRDLGYIIIRWTWADVVSGALLRRLVAILGIPNAA